MEDNVDARIGVSVLLWEQLFPHKSLTRLPAMTEAVGRAVSIETETINRNMDSIMEKLTALQKKIDDRDQNGQRE